MQEMRECEGTVKVHQNCRRKFTDTRKRAVSEENAPKRLRSAELAIVFDWNSCCFLCSYSVDKRNPNREPFASVMTLPIREKLIDRARERNDDWGSQVLARLLVCNDLVA